VTGLLLAYLAWPSLPLRLGAVYLPLALLAFCLIPITGQYLSFQNQAGLTAVDVSEYAWEQMLLLLFPLLLISWQYPFRWVVAFSLVTGIADLLLAFWFVSSAELQNAHYERVVMLRGMAYLAIGYLVTRLVAAQREQRQALSGANRKLTHYTATLERLTVTRERNRLARELHDTLAHTISGLAVQLEAVRSLWDSNPDKARHILDDSLQATRGGLAETRQAIQALRSSPLDDLGLVLAMRNLAENAAGRGGFVEHIELPGSLRLAPDVELVLFRVAQEALENVVRHAEARSVEIRLVDAADRVTLTIRDDGCGFLASQVDTESHFGIQNMRERAEMIGGHFQLASQPGQGTSLCLWVGKDDSASADL
jgi:signal transduction histidine kinase